MGHGCVIRFLPPASVKRLIGANRALIRNVDEGKVKVSTSWVSICQVQDRKNTISLDLTLHTSICCHSSRLLSFPPKFNQGFDGITKSGEWAQTSPLPVQGPDPKAFRR